MQDEAYFDKMCKLAEEIGNFRFITKYVYIIFQPKIQKNYENIAKKKEYKGEILYPIIWVSDGNQEIYFDWLMEGFSIRSFPNFIVERIYEIEKYTLIEILEIWMNNSHEIFDLFTFNWMHWGDKVRNSLKEINQKKIWNLRNQR